jgi:hypothetical protein
MGDSVPAAFVFVELHCAGVCALESRDQAARPCETRLDGARDRLELIGTKFQVPCFGKGDPVT